MSNTENRLLQIDLLRGLAALSVTYFHLARSSGLTDEGIIWSGRYGQLGVMIFFVVSGFVIPYSLHAGRYNVMSFPKWVLKRAIRIAPPYLASIAIGLAVGYIGMGAAFEWPTLSRIALHLAYLNVLTGDWLSPVYWTLAVEFQYYFLVGICFPLFARRKDSIGLLAILAAALVSLLSSNNGFLMHWLPIFGIGMVAFRLKVGITTFKRYCGVTVLLTALTVCAIDISSAIAGVLAGLVICFVKIGRQRWISPFMFLGAISYSLYQVHWDVGRSAVSVLRHVPIFGGFEALRLPIGMCVSVVAAYSLYRLVEVPSLQFSRHLAYRSSIPTEAGKRS